MRCPVNAKKTFFFNIFFRVGIIPVSKKRRFSCVVMCKRKQLPVIKNLKVIVFFYTSHYLNTTQLY